nr:hypothetical protein [Flavobacteriaceae bacterium]
LAGGIFGGIKSADARRKQRRFRIAEIVGKAGRESAVVRGNIMDGNIGLFAKLNEQTLKGLNYEDLNHDLSESAVELSKGHTWQKGYIYAQGDYGYTSNERHLYIPPSVYVKWLFDAIIRQNGFTYSYAEGTLFENVFETTLFENLAITVERTPVDWNVEEGKDPNKEPEVKFEKLFPEIKQRDLFLEVCRIFGLVFKRLENSNHYVFISLNDLFHRKNAVDYSDKLQHTNRIKYSFGEYAQNNIFSWSYDKDVYESLNGDFPIKNKGLKKWTKVEESKFKVSPDNKYKFLEFTKDDKGAKVRNVKTAPYIINVADNKQASSSGLNWQKLIDKYYGRLVEALKYQEFREVEMELTAKDVKDFDFFKLVYLRQYGAYYYCNKIKNYTGKKTTKVELLRVSTIEV